MTGTFVQLARRVWLWLAVLGWGAQLAAAQDVPIDAAPGLGPPLPVEQPSLQRPATPPPLPPKPAPMLTNIASLAWDSTFKEYKAQTNETATKMVFCVTNISDKAVTIFKLRPSCGCTVARMPATPWRMEPGASGKIEVSTDLKGKRGELNKNVAVETSDGILWLRFKVVLPVTAAAVSNMRSRNLMVALGDRQAVFRGSCASCHVAPGVGKLGEDLYDASCAICHDTPQRASMVPPLKDRKFDASPKYWDKWIREGRTNTLMPAFAASHGGPLTEEQVKSLVNYLTNRKPEPPK
jgi:mono/diheme cytochrome c family protein